MKMAAPEFGAYMFKAVFSAMNYTSNNFFIR